MYVHHVDGAPQIIHMECSPIRRHADRPRTAHFDQVTPSFMGPSPDGVEGFDFEGGIDEGDMSPTKKTKIKRGRATPPRHKLPILFF